MKKISLIGAGNIGGTLAHLIALKDLANITLIDVAKGIPQGKALDISQSSSVELFDLKIQGSNNYSAMKDSDVVIITAGIPRLPGMTRDDLLETNTKIISDVGKAIKKFCPKAFLICITNPLDAMVSVLQFSSKVKPNMCVGMAGILDSSRMKYFIAQELKVSIQNIETFVLGGHGDTMVPMLRYTKISGIPIEKFIKNKMISHSKLNSIIKRTQDGGGEINRLLKKGTAFYAPASSAVQMAESYLKNKKMLLPCAAYLNGEYGVKDFYVGVPVIIGKKGVEKIIELSLNDQERKKFNKSIQAVKQLTKKALKLV
ncbi:MAG: malate dehydrogenase [Alphaproteobacteria bacterium MarineAlpha5_Bin9]|nr:MAG: malate dehydrogenase [Alphaproteobacteria bacterium MarineAlpha5_Bin9]|tara:strand:+ start:5892 stop:6836 length:945 start_codon:yes stop_codon:yes gene_type:complete